MLGNVHRFARRASGHLNCAAGYSKRYKKEIKKVIIKTLKIKQLKRTIIQIRKSSNPNGLLSKKCNWLLDADMRLYIKICTRK